MSFIPHPHPDQLRAFVDYLTLHAQGRANAIPARALAAALRLGPSGDRLLRALVHAANEQGLLVVADNAGYFIPASPAEVAEAVGRLRSQASEMLARARLIEDLSDRSFLARAEQLNLDL